MGGNGDSPFRNPLAQSQSGCWSLHSVAVVSKFGHQHKPRRVQRVYRVSGRGLTYASLRTTDRTEATAAMVFIREFG